MHRRTLFVPEALLLDTASAVYRKNAIRQLIEETVHQIVFLPKYSPDLNDIEHDFSALKRKRMYASSEMSLDNIIRDYCAV